MKKIICYGAGVYALNNAHAYIDSKGSIAAFVDRNINLHKRTLGGVKIFLPDEVFENYNNASSTYCNMPVLITAEPYSLADITDTLITKYKVPPKNIINYEPYEKRLCCTKAETCFAYRGSMEMSFCCERLLNPPLVKFSLFPPDFNTVNNKFLELHNDFNNLQNNEFNQCSNCQFYGNRFAPRDYRIRNITMVLWGHCPHSCTYCDLRSIDCAELDFGSDFPLQENLEFFKTRNLLHDKLSISWAIGELTTNKNVEKYIDIMDKYSASIFVNSNCFAYIPALGEQIKSGKAIIITSLDAGIAKTFSKIHGVNEKVFQQSIDNIKQYASNNSSGIIMKYIVIPGLNDNEKDINAFVEVLKEINAERFILSFERYGVHKNVDQLENGFRLLIQRSNEANIYPITSSDNTKGINFDIINDSIYTLGNKRNVSGR